MNLKDIERYHNLRANQAAYMAEARQDIEETVIYSLLLWAEAKAEAEEIWMRKGYQDAMLQAYGCFRK